MFQRLETVRRDPKEGWTRDDQVTEQGGAIPGLTYRANPTYSDNRNTSLITRARRSRI